MKLTSAYWLAFVLSCWLPAPAAPVITEIMASNAAGIVDEDGAASDWIEIYNPDPAAVNLDGWFLTDNSGQPAKWRFPSVTLDPGGFLRVWASGKDRTQDLANLHTNFQLNASGEYLALTMPGGVVRTSEFAPQFPAMETDESYGIPFDTVSLIGPGAAASILIPSDNALGLSWTGQGFVPGGNWLTGPTSAGFGMPLLGFAIQERASSGAVTSITIAENVLNGTNALDNLTGVAPVVNFVGSTSVDGRFGNGVPTLHGGNRDNFAIKATGTLIIPSAGPWTFHVNSDDGFRLRIDGAVVMEFTGGRTPSDSFGTVTLTAGHHELVLTYFGSTGGDEVELSAAAGATASFSNFFKLIGDTAAGGLAILTPPPPGTSNVGTDVGAIMKNVNASAYLRVPFVVDDPPSVESLVLDLASNDGFVAYLNGTEVARRLAPAALAFDSTATGSRTPLESLVPEQINLTAFRAALTSGANVLALHGLNVSAADNSFYVSPRLSRSARGAGTSLFFRKPTPGFANTNPGYLGSVADTEFLPKRGLFTAPIDVAITSATPDAIIRYTTNGSTPTLANGTTYAAPLHLDKTTVVRAAAFRDGYEPTNVDTNTYLFLEDVIRQGSAPYGSRPSTDWPTGSVAGQIINYGMDPTIVNHTNPVIGGPNQVKAALQALPTVCISTDLPNLFHTTTGIYSHPGSHGSAWERPASVELIGDPHTPEGGFQSNCGLRIRGGYSRSTENPKHSFRLFFRGDYGAGTLKYPIYAGEGAGEFDGFDIQCSQNYSWSYHRDTNHNALREIWSRDVQRDLGHPATRGRFVHLYLNAVYWGLYQIQERPEAAFGATYTGGNKDDFDVIKATGSNAGYTTEATDGYFVTIPGGGDSAWKKLWTGSRACYFINTDKNPATPATPLISTKEQKNAAYFKLMGLQADGLTPSGDPVLLDVDNLIDYVMITLFTRNNDAPLTSSGNNPNNFFSFRGRAGFRGFSHIQHDGEHSLNAGGAADRWGPWANTPTTGSWNNINYSNPQYTHQDLTPNAEYKLRFADRIYRAFYNNGPMTLAKNQARLDMRASQIEPAIIAESARWGDSKGTPALNATHWRTARTNTRTWFTSRNTAFLNEAKTKGFFPATLPPDFNQRGGSVPGGFGVVLTNPNAAGSTIYYTTDGSDPRPVGAGANAIVVVPEFATASYLVPSTTNGGSDLTSPQWTTLTAPPNDAQWASGPMGFGWMTRTFVATTDFTPYTKTNLLSLMQPAGGTSSASLYVRVPFTVTAAQIASLAALRVKARFDDAFVVYLNGVEAGRKNTNLGFVPTWDAASATNVSNTTAITQQVLDLSSSRNLLVEGQNLIAFHALNGQTNGDDFLFSPQVEIDTLPTVPTPAYSGPIALFSPTTIRTRILNGTEWSALNEATFFPDTAPASAANLVISEFSYNPLGAQNAGETPYASSDFEFVEIQNISALGVDLTGVQFLGAIAFAFTGTPSEMVLPPGGRRVVAANRDAFVKRYGPTVQPIVGPFAGSLDNSSELIRLVAANSSTIKEFTYRDKAPWPEAADGEGFSLVLINPVANPDHTNPANWRSSAARNGHPATAKGSTYAAWRVEHHLIDDTDDIDADGLTTFAEYVLGTLPFSSDTAALPKAGVGSFLVGQTVGDFLTLVFQRRLAADDVDYEIQSSANLGTGQWAPDDAVLVSESNNGDGTATMLYRSREPITTGQTFFLRLKMSLR